MILTARPVMASPLSLASSGATPSQTYRVAVQQIQSLTKQQDVLIRALAPLARALVTGLKDMRVLPKIIAAASGLADIFEEGLSQDPQAKEDSAYIINKFQRYELIPVGDETVDDAIKRLTNLTGDVAQPPHQGISLRTTHIASGDSYYEAPGIQFHGSAQEMPSLPERLVVRTEYKLRDMLGSGGMGVVYRAHDTESAPEECDVAVKMIKDSDPDERARFKETFTKEARLHRTLISARILRAYASGTSEEGDPFLITDVMQCSLLDYLEGIEEGDRRFEFNKMATMAEQAVEAVVDTHNLGIVHLDIKPENFFIDPKDKVKLGDFGIAQRIEGTDTRDTESAGVISGTPFYMSLEALQGASPALSRDIYALGMTLYEMFAGCLPYDIAGKNPLMHAMDKMLQDPPPPSEIALPGRDIPPEWDRIILKALARHPKDRYKTAEAMLSEVARYRTHELLGRVVSKDPHRSLLPPESVRKRGEEQVPFIGRDDELETLRQAFDASIAEQKSRFVVVSGEPGQGKSRLGTELIDRLKQDGTELSIFTAQGKREAKSPRGAIAGAIRMQAGIEADDELADQRSKLEAFVTRSFGETPASTRGESTRGGEEERILQKELLGQLLGLEFEETSAQLKYWLQNPAELRKQILETVVGLFDRLTQKEPVILVLEDLHWIDIGTLRFTQTLLASLKDRPFFVLGLTRPEREFFDENPPIMQGKVNIDPNEIDPNEKVTFTPNDTMDYPVEVIALKDVDKEHLRQMVDKIIPDRSKLKVTEVNRLEPEDRQADAKIPTVRELLVSRSDRTPFLVQQYAQAVLEGWQIEREPASQQWHFVTYVDVGAERRRKTVPINRDDFLAERVDTYAENEQALLQWAAVLGTTFSANDLKGLSLPNVDVLLAELVNRKALLRLPNGRYQFPHALSREAVYNSLVEKEQRKLHRSRARDLVSKGTDKSGMQADELWAMIAYHYEEAQDPSNPGDQRIREQAATYYAKAGALAAKFGAYKTAASCYEKCFDLSNQAHRQLDALTEWNDALFNDGRKADELSLLDKFDEVAAKFPDEAYESLAKAQYNKGLIYYANRRWPEAEQELQQGIDLFKRDEVALIKCRLLNTLGSVYHQQSQKDEAYRKAQELFELGLKGARRLGETSLAAKFLNNISFVATNIGDYSNAYAAAAEAIELNKDSEDLRTLMYSINNAASALTAIGDYAAALELYRKGINISQDKMQRSFLDYLIPNYGQTARLLGRPEAITQLEEARLLYSSPPNTRMAGETLVYLSLAYADVQHWAQALEASREALSAAGATKDESLEAMALMAQAQAYLGQQKVSQALAASEAAYQLFEQLGAVSEFDLEILLTHARILFEAGKVRESWDIIKEGRELLEKRASNISDPKHRRTYLGRVKVNQTIKQFWDKVRRARSSSDETLRHSIPPLDYVVPTQLPDLPFRAEDLQLWQASSPLKVRDRIVSGAIIPAPTTTAEVLEKLLTLDVKIERNEVLIPLEGFDVSKLPKDSFVKREGKPFLLVRAEGIEWNTFSEAGSPGAELEFELKLGEENALVFPLMQALTEWSPHYKVRLQGHIRQGEEGEVRVNLSVDPAAGRLDNKHFGDISFVLAPTLDGNTMIAIRMQDRRFTQNPDVFLQAFLKELKKRLTAAPSK